MGKQKTRKSWSKRLKLTKSGKVLKRKAGQDHFNSRETGKQRRAKRRDVNAPAGVERAIKDMIA